MNEDTIIALIRFLRKLGVIDLLVRIKQSKLLQIGLILLVIGAGSLIFGGGGSSPADVDVQNTTNVTVIEDGNGSVTFTLGSNESVDVILLKGIEEEPVELTDSGQTYTTSADTQIIVTAVVDGKETLLRTYDPSESDANSDGGDGDGDEDTLTAVAEATPHSAPPGETIEFDANNSTIPEDIENVTYEWTFDDGENATGETVEHAFDTRGGHEAEVTLTAETGETANATVEVSIGNEAPIADIAGDSTGTTTDTLSFSAKGSSDPEGGPITYEWDFDDGETANGSEVEHSFDSVGTFDVRLVVTDEWNDSDSATFTVTTENTPPKANADFPNSGSAGDLLTFNAEESADPDSQNLTYEWDFGDSNTDTGSRVQHTYESSGTYTVRLYVTDEAGASDLYRGIVSVSGSTSDDDGNSGNSGNDGDSNSAPTARISAPSSGEAGQEITFDGAASTDPDGDSLTYTWDFGDGTTGAGVSDTNTYDDTGSFTVMLTVTDGKTADSTTETITLQNSGPTASAEASPTPTNPTETVTFDASASTDPNGDTLSYAWDFGEGTTATGETVTHEYDEVGTYDVTVTVTDPDGASDSHTFTVSVENRAPDAEANVDSTISYVGQDRTFDATESSDPDGDAMTHEWDLDDDGTIDETGETVTHAFSSVGTHTVALTTTDAEGVTNSDTVTVTVENRAPSAAVSVDKTDVYANEDITFDASDSDDLDGQELTYRWDFDNGVISNEGPVVTHSYDESESYTVTLTVTDTEGASDTTTTTEITVDNRKPTAAFEVNKSTTGVTQPIEFDPSGTHDVDEQEDLTYSWDFDNSKTLTTNSNEAFDYSFANARDYNVTLTVTDPGGEFSITSEIVTVENNAPTANAGSDQTVAVGEEVTFDGSGSSDPEDQTLNYEWDFADGNSEPGSGETTTHTYDTADTYEVTLTVTDGTNTATDTVEITVE